jgi:membrane-bound ClpP family serine protease
MGFIITLILVGLVLMFAEILLVPGVGVAGILGLISMGGSCFCAFHQYGNTVGAIVTAVNVLLLIALIIWVLRAKTWKRMTLETNIDSKAVSSEAAVLAVGDRGKTLTRLAPMGQAVIWGESTEVKALEGMIDSNVEVVVVMIDDNKIYVKPKVNEF